MTIKLLSGGMIEKIRTKLYPLIGLSLVTLVSGCSAGGIQTGEISLNSRYNDEQPALSGDGNWLAFVSNRNGTNQIILYNIQEKKISRPTRTKSQSNLSRESSLKCYSSLYSIYY